MFDVPPPAPPGPSPALFALLVALLVARALLVELDDGHGWVGAGIRSMAHWLTLTCGFTSYEAERRARLVRRGEELACLFEAFDRGALSVGFTAAAEKVATAHNGTGGCGRGRGGRRKWRTRPGGLHRAAGPRR